MVGVLSSAARMPLPGDTSASATFSRSSFMAHPQWTDGPTPLSLLFFAESLAVGKQQKPIRYPPLIEYKPIGNAEKADDVIFDCETIGKSVRANGAFHPELLTDLGWIRSKSCSSSSSSSSSGLGLGRMEDF